MNAFYITGHCSVTDVQSCIKNTLMCFSTKKVSLRRLQIFDLCKTTTPNIHAMSYCFYFLGLCESSPNSRRGNFELCYTITADSPLKSLYRLDAKPSSCPIQVRRSLIVTWFVYFSPQIVVCMKK